MAFPIDYVSHSIEDMGAFSNRGNLIFLHLIFSPRLATNTGKNILLSAKFHWAQLVHITPVLDLLAIRAISPLDLISWNTWSERTYGVEYIKSILHLVKNIVIL